MRTALLLSLALATACSAQQSTPVPTPSVPVADAPLMKWPDLLDRKRPAPDATLNYGPDAYQKVDVWLPNGARGRIPVVLMVHGGCWTSGIADRSIMNWIADDLRQRGIAVWNIDYRGVDVAGGGYPGTFRDAAAATDLLRAHAARLKLDTRNIVVVGHSAGGHLALWLAGRRNLPKDSPLAGGDPLRIARVVSLGGLPDLKLTAASPDNGCGTDVVGKLTGPPTKAHLDVYADTSVPALLPLGVRQDLVNGREDRIIPIRLADDYVAKAKVAGDRVALHIVPRTGHVELIAPESAAWAATVRLIQRAPR